MKNRKYLIALIYALIMVSCSSIKSFFSEEVFKDFDNYHLRDAIAFEKRAHSEDITRKYLTGISEGIYPNINKYVLATPQTFKHKQRGFEIETAYYYSLQDSSVRLVLYEWNEPVDRKDRGFSIRPIKSKAQLTKAYEKFQIKFDELRLELTKAMGEPYEIKIEHTNKEDTFRDDVKWKTKNGLNAYMFMFGNESQSFRQIRIAVYSK